MNLMKHVVALNTKMCKQQSSGPASCVKKTSCGVLKQSTNLMKQLHYSQQNH